jgi:Uma2 family endonuclease
VSLLKFFVNITQLGKVVSAPFEVKLSPLKSSREPDIFFVSNENLSRLKGKRLEGAPDLVVEIISPSSVREDKVRKFDEYEQAGVPEYWLIDPRPRFETAEFFQLNDEGIYQPVEVDENGRYHSRILPNFWLNSDWLWQDPQPNPQRCLAEIIISSDAFPPTLRQLYQGLYDYLQ